MLVPTNGDYLWVHDQHEKWNTKAKETLQQLDQVIDSHLGWYDTHKTTSDIIRTRRAMPDLSLAHKQSRKRKLSDAEEPAQVTEDVFMEADHPTDRSDQEEENVAEKEHNDDNNNSDNNQTQEEEEEEKEIHSRESNKFHVVENTENALKGDHNNPKDTNTPLKQDKIEVVSSIRIQSAILDSLEKTPEQPKPSFISRLLNLSKNKAVTPSTTASASTASSIASTTTANTQVSNALTTTTTEINQPVIEAEDQTLKQDECPPPPNKEDAIVVSEVVPEPRLKFQSKKKRKTQEKTTEQDQVSKADTSISSTTTNGSNKVIREIDDEEQETPPHEKQKTENKGPFVPSWAKSPELERHLERQQRLDPGKIFGSMKPIKLKDIFKTRLSSSSKKDAV